MITFRPIEHSDLPLLKTWRNSEFVRPYVREYRLLNDTDQEKWYQSYLDSRRKSDFDQEIIILERLGHYKSLTEVNFIVDHSSVHIPIGVGGFTRIEWHNRKAELTFYIGNDESRSKYVIEECISRLFYKGFNEFNFNKIYWPVYSHDPNLCIYKSLFDDSIILEKEYYWDGIFRDRVYLSKYNPSN